jgi:hypothetical protein
VELAQVNVALMRAPLDDPVMAGFAHAFDAVARLAEESPGFVWRLPTGHEVVTDADGQQVVNVSVWQTYRNLHGFVYRSVHGRMLLRRQQWFLPTRQPSTALWWLPDGSRPSVEQALARLRHLRTYGPTPLAFSLLRQFTPEGRPVRRAVGHGSR